AEGSRVVSAVAVDTAGNAGPAAIPVSLTVDRTPPAAPALLAPEKGALLNSERTLVLGRSDPGAAVSLTLDGAAVEVLAGPRGAHLLSGRRRRIVRRHGPARGGGARALGGRGRRGRERLAGGGAVLHGAPLGRRGRGRPARLGLEGGLRVRGGRRGDGVRR